MDELSINIQGSKEQKEYSLCFLILVTYFFLGCFAYGTFLFLVTFYTKKTCFYYLNTWVMVYSLSSSAHVLFTNVASIKKHNKYYININIFLSWGTECNILPLFQINCYTYTFHACQCKTLRIYIFSFVFVEIIKSTILIKYILIRI